MEYPRYDTQSWREDINHLMEDHLNEIVELSMIDESENEDEDIECHLKNLKKFLVMIHPDRAIHLEVFFLGFADDSKKWGRFKMQDRRIGVTNSQLMYLLNKEEIK